MYAAAYTNLIRVSSPAQNAPWLMDGNTESDIQDDKNNTSPIPIYWTSFLSMATLLPIRNKCGGDREKRFNNLFINHHFAI
jgi:hypothetical protein